MVKVGRYSDLNNDPEVRELEAGMDFRLPRFRREVFLRFYEFHLKYKAHPGAVYYVMPFLAEVNGWGPEEKLWFAYINGNTQHPLTSYIIFSEFPSLAKLDRAKLRTWFQANYEKLEFDTDRRYFKTHFLECVSNYLELLRGRTQEAFFNSFASSQDERENFRRLWSMMLQNYIYFGRLSCFSYAEYLRINGVRVECDQLFLEDMNGSKSHRNGLCKVLGRDDLDWHDSNPAFPGYPPNVIAWLKEEADRLLFDARYRMQDKPYFQDVGFFTLESTLCNYKSWHRPNRRYPNVYNDMFYNRIKKSETRWGTRFGQFWAARKKYLPQYLRLEDNPADCGVVPKKQNHYLKTGQPIMMDREWPCFVNDFNDAVNAQQAVK